MNINFLLNSPRSSAEMKPFGTVMKPRELATWTHGEDSPFEQVSRSKKPGQRCIVPGEGCREATVILKNNLSPELPRPVPVRLRGMAEL